MICKSITFFKESTFAYLKAIGHKFKTMTHENVAVLARAGQNHLSDWLKANNYASVTGGSVKKVYYELREERRREIERRDNENHDPFHVEEDFDNELE